MDRKLPPAFNRDTTFTLLKPEIQKLNSGNKVLFINGGEQDVIKIELIFDAGRWFENNRGVSHFTAILLPKGTTTLTSYQITNKLDYYGIHLEINPGMDFTSLAIYGLTRHVPHVLDLLIDILTHTTFAEDELLQAKDIYVQGLKINLEKTSYLAARAFRKNIFGANHPYGMDFELTDVNSLSQSQLTEFRNAFFRNFTAFVSGKISDQIKKEITSKLTTVKSIKIPAREHAKSPSALHNYHVDKEGSVQTSLRLGKLTISRKHKDYAGLVLLNHILGGYFGSRLMKNIREEKGLTYGIHSSIHALKHDSYFVIGADVNKENRFITIEEIKNELERLSAELITPDELEVAQNHFIGSFQSDLNTPFAHTDKIKTISLFDLSENYYQELINAIAGVKPEHLQDLAQTHLSKDQLYTTSTG